MNCPTIVAIDLESLTIVECATVPDVGETVGTMKLRTHGFPLICRAWPFAVYRKVWSTCWIAMDIGVFLQLYEHFRGRKIPEVALIEVLPRRDVSNTTRFVRFAEGKTTTLPLA